MAGAIGIGGTAEDAAEAIHVQAIAAGSAGSVYCASIAATRVA